MAVTWSVLYMFFDMTADSALASVVLLILCSWACGKAVGMVGLPPLLGMLMAGMVLANTGYYEGDHNAFQPHIINLRSDQTYCVKVFTLTKVILKIPHFDSSTCPDE